MNQGDVVLYEFQVCVVTDVRSDGRLELTTGWMTTSVPQSFVREVTARSLGISVDYQCRYSQFQEVSSQPFNMSDIKDYFVNSWLRAIQMTDEEYNAEAVRLNNFIRAAMDGYKLIVDNVYIFRRSR